MLDYRCRPRNKCGVTLTTLLLALCALVFAFAAGHSLLYLGDVTVPEGAVVYAVKGLLSGAWPLYRDYTVPPYATTPYTPLFYLVSAALAWSTDQSISSIYIVCRLLTFASTLMAAFLVQR